MLKEKKLEKVGIVKCRTYNQKEIDNSVKNVLELSGIILPEKKKVLIKPNIVGYFGKNQKAITTNISIIKSICKLLKKNNCKIYIGESSFTNTVCAFKKTGIDKIANRYGKLLIFEQDKLSKINDKKAEVLKNFYLSKTLRDVDLIINIPKLKTHTLTRYTGAIKNLYGCIPGGMKQKLHYKAKTGKRFSKLLLDIYQNIRPEINIMDGVLGMEGRGPTAGKPKKAGYILASKNAVALDVVSCQLMGYNPKKILMIKEAVKRKLGNFEFELKGVKKVPNLNFKKPIVFDVVPSGIMERFRQKPIIVDKNKCIQCGLCAEKCPAKAITLSPFPVIDKKKCIRCFCCMEICPKHALYLKE